MKHLYSIISLFFILISVSLQSQERVYAPSLYFPEDSEVGLEPNVTLDWNAVTGETLVVLYELQIADNADFNNAFTFPKSEITSKEMMDLSFGTMYYWRVKAYDGDQVSDWSEVWKFTVATSIEMLTPADGASVYSSPKITWKLLPGLLKYQIQIDTSYIWNNVLLETSESILGSFIIDETNMWLVGTNGLVLHNDGTTWTELDAGTTEDLNSIFFVDANNGFVVGNNGTFLNFDGTTWTSIETGTSENIGGVAFADAENGYLVGDGGLILKYASGTITTEVATSDGSDITSDLYDVAVVDANNYWACGKSKIVINFDGTSWTGGVIGSKDHSAVWFNNANDGWISSKAGRIQHFDGTDWTEFQSVNKDLYDISFAGTTGFAVGKSGTLLIYDGAEWSLITSGTTSNLNTIFLKDDYGISGGDAGTLINKAGEGFNSPYAKIINVIPDSNNYSLKNLLFGKTFYYRMRGVHSLDTSNWSGAKSMITYPYPSLTAPVDNSSDKHLKLVFKWAVYTGVTKYYIQISKSEDFLTSLTYSSDSNSISINDLTFGDEYFWRVRAEHSEDLSAWSTPFSFNTINTISLLTPVNSAVNVLKCPHYSWVEIVGASGYQISIDTDENFSNPFTDVSDKAYYQCQNPLNEKTTYYWKVRGISGLDSSNWSQTWAFETEGPDAIEDIFSDKSLEVYPNPSNGNFTLGINSLETASYKVNVTDISGKVIYKSDVFCEHGYNKISLDLKEDLSSGIYFINVSHENMVANKRLIIK